MPRGKATPTERPIAARRRRTRDLVDAHVAVVRVFASVAKKSIARWLVGVPVAIVVLVAIAFFAIRREVRLAIEEQCSVALQGTCTIDNLSVSADGAAAHGIHLEAKLGLASGDIEAIEVRFAWWPLIVGEKQGIALRVLAPKFKGSLPIGNIVREGRRMGEGLSAKNTPSRVRLDAFAIERGEIRASIPLIADARIESIAADWKRDRAFTARWEDASFESLLESYHTGECKAATKKNSEKLTIDCGKLVTTVDVAKLESIADLVKLLARKK